MHTCVQVVPVDDSDHSRLSVDFAVSQLLSSKDKLCLISVADPVYGPYTPEVSAAQQHPRMALVLIQVVHHWKAGNGVSTMAAPVLA